MLSPSLGRVSRGCRSDPDSTWLDEFTFKQTPLGFPPEACHINFYLVPLGFQPGSCQDVLRRNWEVVWSCCRDCVDESLGLGARWDVKGKALTVEDLLPQDSWKQPLLGGDGLQALRFPSRCTPWGRELRATKPTLPWAPHSCRENPSSPGSL